MESWIARALALGFQEAVLLDIQTLHPLPAVRDMCAEDKCRAYNRNWTCPPACGTLAECAERIAKCSSGILLQTVGQLTRSIDTKAMRKTEERHLELLHQFSAFLREHHPNALCLGAGGCRICDVCAYPEPCRFPQMACSSMEAYGLFVTQVCRDNHLPYYHGEKTITYTACVLF